jgi:glycosyltransferase involved in cell wall biosynthesis
MQKTTDRKRILFVTNSVLVYGGELSLLEVIRNHASNPNVRIIVIVPQEGPFSEELKKLDVDFIALRYYKWVVKKRLRRFLECPVKNVFNYFAANSLNKIAKDFEPNLIYTNSITANIGAKVALNLGIPHIWHLREFLHEDIGTLFTTNHERARKLINSSKSIICNSEAIKNGWRDLLNSNEFDVVYNGFHFEQRTSNDRDKYKIVVEDMNPINVAIIGSVHNHKNQIVAVKAIGHLKKAGKNILLRIYGEGNPAYIDMLKQLAIELDVETNIKWMGYVTNPFETLNDVALTIMCSKKEAFGRVIVESMGKGIPVIAPNSGGIPEIIVSGKTGILYKVGSDQELAKCITELVENEDKYNCIVEQAYDDVIKRFSVSGYLANIDKVIERTISSKTN